MNAHVRLQTLLSSSHATTDEALAVFDSLQPVSVEFMLGRWKGAGVNTGHPMDGLLENFQWHGKHFESAEVVHPLVFTNGAGSRVHLQPRFMPMQHARNSALARHVLTRTLFQWVMPLMSTRRSAARLRMVEYRGKSSATMVYDHLPINDTFRRIDDNTVLGLMDLKGMKKPFFFMLSREAD